MPDERYKKFLGIEPLGERPSYYELLDIASDETNEEVLEKAYKTQIRKLQQIRTSKDIGWIEYNKETLRTARRILKDKKRRAEYDKTLQADAEAEFREFVQTLLSMLSQTMIDTVLVPKGVSDGLSEEDARRIIDDLARENNITIGAEDDAGEDDEEDEDYDDGYDDQDEGYDSAPARGGEVVLEASPGWSGGAGSAAGAVQEAAQPVAPAREVSPPWIMAEEDSDAMPWGRGGSRSWGQAKKRKKREETEDLVEDSWLDDESRKHLSDAIQAFNLAARLAKVGSNVHRSLRMYFPPANGKTAPTPKINGVSFEKMFDTQRRTYQDTLKAFRDATARVGDVQSPRADDLRQRSGKNVALVKGYLEEMNRHKMNLMGGLAKAETLRAWQNFLNSRRSPRLHKTIAEMK